MGRSRGRKRMRRKRRRRRRIRKRRGRRKRRRRKWKKRREEEDTMMWRTTTRTKSKDSQGQLTVPFSDLEQDVVHVPEILRDAFRESNKLDARAALPELHGLQHCLPIVLRCPQKKKEKKRKGENLTKWQMDLSVEKKISVSMLFWMHAHYWMDW